jgi:glycerol-3-phosphate acyltransferase PlsY
MNAAPLVGLVLFAYLLGAVPFGLVVGKLFFQTDVRLVGSGNIGATNVARAAGKKAAILVLALDTLKSFLPAWIVRVSLVPGAADPAAAAWWPAAIGFAAFLGHVFPVYLRFRGGKGVATALGVLFAVVPWIALAALLTYAVIYGATRVSSIGSLTAVVLTTVLTCFFAAYPAYVAVVLAMMFLIFVRHAGNIRRLLQRQETKV